MFVLDNWIAFQISNNTYVFYRVKLHTHTHFSSDLKNTSNMQRLPELYEFICTKFPYLPNLCLFYIYFVGYYDFFHHCQKATGMSVLIKRYWYPFRVSLL